jgi:hypothetical protein
VTAAGLSDRAPSDDRHPPGPRALDRLAHRGRPAPVPGLRHDHTPDAGNQRRGQSSAEVATPSTSLAVPTGRPLRGRTSRRRSTGTPRPRCRSSSGEIDQEGSDARGRVAVERECGELFRLAG